MSLTLSPPESVSPETSPAESGAASVAGGAASGRISLPAGCGTTMADELRTQLVLAADFADATAIDASGVESVGQAVLQLLVAARREAVRDGHQFTIVAASPAFVDRVTACGLAQAIGLVMEMGEVG